MIVCDRLRWFFLHLPRTGGSWLSWLLEDHAGGLMLVGKHPTLAECWEAPEIRARREDGFQIATWIRNPYWRVLSWWLANFLDCQQRTRTFDNFTAALPDYLPPMTSYLGDTEPDFTGRWENGRADYVEWFRTIGLDPELLDLPWKRHPLRFTRNYPRPPSFRGFYTAESRANVERFHGADLERWDYSFSQHRSRPYPW